MNKLMLWTATAGVLLGLSSTASAQGALVENVLNNATATVSDVVDLTELLVSDVIATSLSDTSDLTDGLDVTDGLDLSADENADDADIGILALP